jgi:hypothetical protein
LGRNAAPGPAPDASSPGFDIEHLRSDRQPQPMHDCSPSRSLVNAVISSSRRCRHDRDSRAQSSLVGVRASGRVASASPTSSRLSPTLRAARMKASRRSMVR